jgi:hypothetical protein
MFGECRSYLSAAAGSDRECVVAHPQQWKDNVRVGVESPGMPIPSTDSITSNNLSERESHHRMLIDADSPASSTVAASLL